MTRDITIETIRPDLGQVFDYYEVLKQDFIGLRKEQAYDLWLQSPEISLLGKSQTLNLLHLTANIRRTIDKHNSIVYNRFKVLFC